MQINCKVYINIYIAFLVYIPIFLKKNCYIHDINHRWLCNSICIVTGETSYLSVNSKMIINEYVQFSTLVPQQAFLLGHQPNDIDEIKIVETFDFCISHVPSQKTILRAELFPSCLKMSNTRYLYSAQDFHHLQIGVIIDKRCVYYQYYWKI